MYLRSPFAIAQIKAIACIICESSRLDYKERSHFAIPQIKAIACIICESSRLDYKERSPFLYPTDTRAIAAKLGTTEA
jgi:hypothetical protein